VIFIAFKTISVERINGQDTIEIVSASHYFILRRFGLCLSVCVCDLQSPKTDSVSPSPFRIIDKIPFNEELLQSVHVWLLTQFSFVYSSSPSQRESVGDPNDRSSLRSSSRSRSRSTSRGFSAESLSSSTEISFAHSSGCATVQLKRNCILWVRNEISSLMVTVFCHPIHPHTS
jgi:hypothetical protein